MSVQSRSHGERVRGETAVLVAGDGDDTGTPAATPVATSPSPELQQDHRARFSPDPLHPTDRYRLATPFTLRL